MLLLRNTRRSYKYVLFAFWCLVVYLTYITVRKESIFGISYSASSKNLQYTFYNELFDALTLYKPLDPPEDPKSLRNKSSCKLVGNYGLNDVDRFHHLNHYNLKDCYHLNDEQFNSLHSMHKGYVERIQQFPANLASILSPNGKGIVTVGGGRYSVLLLTMLETLRQSGTSLPIEVFIPPMDEGDVQFCEDIVTKFNAKCVYFSDILPPNVLENLRIKSYQIKALALVMSSYEHVLFIDADNFAMKNVDNVFNSDVYKETGLVVWPDLWKRVTAPVYYDIAEIKYDLNTRVRWGFDDLSPVSRYQTIRLHPMDSTSRESNVPFHDLDGTISDPSTESGQMLINKKKHLDTLLLALYYNIYGPMWYYKIFSQGTAGEGDKETFISAAHTLNKPYYQVRTPLSFDGFHHDVKNFQGLGLLQYDFDQDYKLHQKIKEQIANDIDKYSVYDPDYDMEKTFRDQLLKQNGPNHDSFVDVMFMHASFYKFDPWFLYNEKCFVSGAGQHIRGYSRQHDYNNFDFELFNFQVLQKYLCNTDESKQIRNFKYLDKKFTQEDWPAVCKYIDDHVAFLLQNPIKSTTA